MTSLKLLPITRRDQELLMALGRKGCPEICVVVKSDKRDEWKIVSDVFYALKSQRPIPWATYAQLIEYLIENGFLEKSQRVVGRRKFNLVRLTPLGDDLVRLYVEGFLGKKVEDLTPEQ
jgi:predicted transcriptional regulator